MKHLKARTPRVVDNYFPDWMVKWVSNDLENTLSILWEYVDV
jgi:hypothetical protein